MIQLIEKLWGGNQQKVLFGRRSIKEGLKVLIVDESMLGIDVGVNAEIYYILNLLAHEGLAIVMMLRDARDYQHVRPNLHHAQRTHHRGVDKERSNAGKKHGTGHIVKPATAERKVPGG